MKFKKGLLNVIVGFVGQLIILTLGVLVPRFILQSYGDEANGLISAIGQIFVYLALIESGVGQASLQSLYKPIVENDKKSISSILVKTRSTYRWLTLIYCGFVVIIATFYPLFVQVKDATNIQLFGSTYFSIMLVVLVQGFSNAFAFFFAATIRQLMIADGSNYIIVNITTIIKILTSVFKIVLINLGIHIVLLQIVYLALSALEALIYIIIIKTRYGWIDWRAEQEEKALSERKYFVIHEISNVIFNSTDILILSIFCDLTVASVYAIFNMIFSALNALISQIHNGCFFVLGQEYKRENNSYKVVHDIYDTCYMAMVFALISVAYLLINPFVTLYTNGVTNVNYTDPWLALLFCLVQLLSCCRITSSNLIKVAGHAKKTINRAIVEAAINLVASLVLVNLFGIHGVLLGTIVALVYRTNDMVVYANKKILNRSPWKTYRTIIVYSLMFVGVVITNECVQIRVVNYSAFFGLGAILATISLILYFAAGFLLERNILTYLKKARLSLKSK